MKMVYAISAVKKQHDISICGVTRPLDLTWADGMIGVLPVFKNKKAAKKYAGKNIEVLSFTVPKTEVADDAAKED